MEFILNDVEQERLDGLDYAHEALYRRAIRRNMDIVTGLVGVAKAITWQSLLGAMYLSPRKGVQQKNLSRDQLRRMAKQLVKAGLIIMQSTEDKQLIIECPLANRENKAARIPATKAASVAEAESLVVSGFGEHEEEKAARIPASNCVDQIKAARIPASRLQESNLAQTRAQLDLFGDVKDEATTKAASISHQSQGDLDNIDISNINNNINNSILSKFDKFWTIYPRKQKKKLAQKLWVKKQLHFHIKKITDDIAWRTANDPQWQNPQFIPLPTTYFNDERWEDERIGSVHACTENRRFGKSNSITAALDTIYDIEEERQMH